MPPAPPQQGQDSGLGPMWIVIGIFALILIIWYLLRVQISEGFLYFKLYEIKFLSLFTNDLAPTKNWILNANPEHVTFQQLIVVANQVGRFMGIPVAVILLVMAYFLYRRSIGHRFRHSYTMKTLLKAENSVWKVNTPVVNKDLLKDDIDHGVWSMANTPMQFAKRNKLLKEVKKEREEGMLRREATLEVNLMKAKAGQKFVQQIGRPWQGVDKLHMHEKALFAIFAARIGDDADAARELTLKIAASASAKRLDFTGVNDLLKKYGHTEEVNEIVGRHAFVLTALASMLEMARQTGVLATADFLWLKPIDRRLWFMLNGVGRQTPSVEVSGPFAHWLVEKSLGRKVVTPMVSEAVKALDEALKLVIYKPGDE